MLPMSGCRQDFADPNVQILATTSGLLELAFGPARKEEGNNDEVYRGSCLGQHVVQGQAVVNDG
jgi:hypothetical protein